MMPSAPPPPAAALPPAKFPSWGLWSIALPLLLQTGLIVALPLQAAIAIGWGRTVILRTVPVDPYDPFRGYYTTLRYDISQRGILSTLAGWDTVKDELEPTSQTRLLEPGKSFFVVLEAPANLTEAPDQPWQAISISRRRPRSLASNQIALKGTYWRESVLYGLERYYLPEAERLTLERKIREAQTDTEQPRLTVEVRIGPLGNAVPIALRLKEERIEF